MSDLALLIPVVAIAVGPAMWVANTWIRARHGYPIDSMKGEPVERIATLSDERRIALLTSENERLTGKVDRLEERLAVLERIATDPATRTYAEIEALRGR